MRVKRRNSSGKWKMPLYICMKILHTAWVVRLITSNPTNTESSYSGTKTLGSGAHATILYSHRYFPVSTPQGNRDGCTVRYQLYERVLPRARQRDVRMPVSNTNFWRWSKESYIAKTIRSIDRTCYGDLIYYGGKYLLWSKVSTMEGNIYGGKYLLWRKALWREVSPMKGSIYYGGKKVPPPGELL